MSMIKTTIFIPRVAGFGKLNNQRPTPSNTTSGVRTQKTPTTKIRQRHPIPVGNDHEPNRPFNAVSTSTTANACFRRLHRHLMSRPDNPTSGKYFLRSGKQCTTPVTSVTPVTAHPTTHFTFRRHFRFPWAYPLRTYTDSSTSVLSSS